MLEYQNLPMWSRLEFVNSGPAIDFVVHPEATGFLSELKTQKFDGFVDDGENWGFGGKLRRTVDADGSHRFRIPILPFRIQTNEKCRDCRGSGKTQFDGRCIRCNGAGFDEEICWDHVTEVSKSVSLLSDRFLGLITGDVKTTSKKLQVMATFTGTTETYFPISGYFSPIFVKWLKSKRGYRSNPKDSVASAMISVWKVMEAVKGNDLYPYDDRQFWWEVHESGWLNISCPGDACGIHPGVSYIDPNRDDGYDFSCHNMDNPMQQLVLMAALAQLEMNCRREIEGELHT